MMNKAMFFPYENEDANGNAWFVEELRQVSNANEEIQLLDSLDNKRIAISVGTVKEKQFKVDSLASIEVEEYKPNYIKYISKNLNNGFAVFSEIYYQNGWNAYIDGELFPHMRVNYALRGMEIPKGRHTIEFKFGPQVVKTGSTVAMASSIILVLLLLGGLFYAFKNSKPSA